MMCSVQESMKTWVRSLISINEYGYKRIRHNLIVSDSTWSDEQFARLLSWFVQKYHKGSSSSAEVYNIYNHLRMKGIESLRSGYYIPNTISDIGCHNNRNGQECTRENCAATIFSINGNNAFNTQSFGCSTCIKDISGRTGRIKDLCLKEPGNSIMRLKRKRCGKICTINADHPHGGGEGKRKHIEVDYPTGIQQRGEYTNQKDRQFNPQRAAA